MSTTQQTSHDDIEPGLHENCLAFLQQYAKDEIAATAQNGGPVVLSWRDIRDYDIDLADKARQIPQVTLQHMRVAMQDIDIPLPVDFEDVEIRIVDMPDHLHKRPGEIRHEDGMEYVAIDAVLERITSTADVPQALGFECTRCGTLTLMQQDIHTDGIDEPHECQGCERQGPYNIDHQQSEWSDYAKLRLKAPPGAGDEQEGRLTGYVLDSLIDEGGDAGLIGRAGQHVTAYGILRRQQKTGRDANDLLFDHVLDVRAIEFDRDEETVDVDAHRDEFEALASGDDPIETFADSIAPQLHATDAWETAMEFAVAYLFGAPRVDIPNGPTYRGDLHFLIISDYGMGKSAFREEIQAYSPECIAKSTTALSSGVGLTAAAVKDDFGEGQWTIKPGLLVRANGGHLILDEIDKGPDELTSMNDALEGEQMVDIEKAGKSVTYESRTALMALGNPIDGRFDREVAISEQLGISESLLSRFDGIVTMQDEANETQDRKIAEAFGEAYTEAQHEHYASGADGDRLDRPVPIDVGQAWIKHARENVNPLLSMEQFEGLKEWYASEVRQLNEFGDGGQDMPVPATVRVLGAAVKMAIAFARVRLQDEVHEAQIDRAKTLAKTLVGQNWDGEKYNAAREFDTGGSQKNRRESIVQYLNANGATGIQTLVDELGIEIETLRHDMEKLMERGDVTQPNRNEERWRSV